MRNRAPAHWRGQHVGKRQKRQCMSGLPTKHTKRLSSILLKYTLEDSGVLPRGGYILLDLSQMRI